ncbi:MAG: hypothetical protein K8R89_01445 [Anaerolineae bacterium]|nr:hypothetical protein [Anaerolineae bacterium]
MSKHKLIIVVSVCALCLGLWGVVIFRPQVSLASQGPEDVARQQLPEILRKVSRLGCEKYGFRDENELESAVLGFPYEVYTLSPQAVQSYRADQCMADLIVQEQRWEFPVLVNGEARGLLTVAQQEGQWRVVGFGELTLSRKVVDLQAGFANAEVNGVSPYSVKLLNVYPIQGTFALIESEKQETLVYLTSYPGLFETLDQAPLERHSPEELLPQIREALATLSAGHSEARP